MELVRVDVPKELARNTFVSHFCTLCVAVKTWPRMSFVFEDVSVSQIRVDQNNVPNRGSEMPTAIHRRPLFLAIGYRIRGRSCLARFWLCVADQRNQKREQNS
jgi:hypothetical protein